MAPSLDKALTALLAVDLENDIVHEKGALWASHPSAGRARPSPML